MVSNVTHDLLPDFRKDASAVDLDLVILPESLDDFQNIRICAQTQSSSALFLHQAQVQILHLQVRREHHSIVIGRPVGQNVPDQVQRIGIHAHLHTQLDPIVAVNAEDVPGLGARFLPSFSMHRSLHIARLLLLVALGSALNVHNHRSILAG
jgi:hypothetical protein